MSKKKQIFISHSGKDEQIVRDFVDLILNAGMNISTNLIFCSSLEGMKITSGDDWRNAIYDSLISAKINLLIITPNYKESEVCMNEMGAAWVLGGKVFPLIVEPINFATVGVIQQPKQVEKLLNETSLDNIKDEIQKHLEIKSELISSARWTVKKKEFLLKVNDYISKNPFEKPMDKIEFASLVKEKSDLESTITSIIAEKSELDSLIEKLKATKDKTEIKKILIEHSDNSEYEEFESLTESVSKLLTEFHPIINGIIFKTYSNKHLDIKTFAYTEYIDDALAYDYINDELYANFDTTPKMRKVKDALDKLNNFMERSLSDEFLKQYEDDYEEPYALDNRGFWEQVLEIKIFLS